MSTLFSARATPPTGIMRVARSSILLIALFSSIFVCCIREKVHVHSHNKMLTVIYLEKKKKKLTPDRIRTHLATTVVREQVTCSRPLDRRGSSHKVNLDVAQHHVSFFN